MTKGTRALVSIAVGFVLARICMEFIPAGVAVGLGVITGAVTWVLTARRSSPPS